MIIKQFKLGPLANFSYIVGGARGECVLIDPSWDISAILQTAEELKLRPSAVLLTHGHFDHADGALDYAKRAGLTAYVERGDEHMLESKHSAGIKTFSGDSEFELAGLKIKAIHTPGHTRGGCCYLIEGALFTGDTLFVRECGRVDLPESDPGLMWESLVKLSKLPPETLVYPGHFYNDSSSTIGAELKTNPFLKLALQGKEDFLEAMG